MATNQESEERRSAHEPVYFRWRDERSPYAVEFNLSLVPKLLADLAAAEQLGLEAGGILIGSFPRVVGLPSLRVDSYELVGRRGNDGMPYTLTADQHTRFTASRKRATTRETTALGYFRSHLRTGPFELTIADRDLLAGEFKNSIHVALLIGKDQSTPRGAPQRFLATFFVSVNGIIQNRIDPIAFPFDVEELENRNQVPAPLRPETSGPKSAIPPALAAPPAGKRAASEAMQAERKRSSGGNRAAIVALAVFCMFCGLFAAWGWDRQGTRLTGPLWLGDAGLDLTVQSEKPVDGRILLRVDWNHQCPLLLSAAAGRLTLTNGQTHALLREVNLSPLELAAGRVDVELNQQPVSVSLALSMADSTSVAQEAGWPATGAAAK